MSDLKKEEERTATKCGIGLDEVSPFAFSNYGGICSQCKRVYSPFTMMFPYCKGCIYYAG